MSIVDKGVDRLADRFAEEMAGLRADLQAGLLQTSNANRLKGARVIPMTGFAGARVALNGSGALMGWTLRNSAASGQVNVNLYDSHDAGGDLIGTISLGSASSWQQAQAWFGPAGVSITEALFVEVVVVSGGATLAGALYLRGPA